MRLLGVFAALLTVAACTVAPHGERTVAAASPGSMTAVWAGIIERIKSLEVRRASRAEWRAAAQFEEVVRSRRDLNQVVEGLALDDLTEAEAVAWYQKSRTVAHYGFDANLHALVFFDAAGRTARVLR